MSAVSETIVREYFEQHGFLVRQQRKYIAQAKREDDDIDFFILHPRPQKSAGELPFVLSSIELAFVERAIVGFGLQLHAARFKPLDRVCRLKA